MIRLIQVELYKILHRKSIYIIWLLMFAFCFLNNYLYKIDYDANGNYKYQTTENLTAEKQILEQQLAKLSKEQDLTSVATIKTQLNIISLKETYDPNTWQYQKLSDYFYNLIYQINYLTLTKENDLHLHELTTLYQDQIHQLNNNNWQYFTTKEKETLELELTTLNNQLDHLQDSNQKEQLTTKITELTNQLKILDYRLNNNIPEDNNYLNIALNNYLDYQQQVITLEKITTRTYQEELTYQNTLKELALNKYILETKQNINKQNNLNYQLRTIVEDYELFIVLIILLVSTTIICDEFRTGTIKLLLIKPYSRGKILLGKYLTALILLLLTIIFLIGFQLLVGGFIFGFTSLKLPVVVYHYSQAKIIEYPIFNYMFIRLLANFPFLILLLTITFLLAVLTTNSSLALVITLIFYLFSDYFNQLASHSNLQFLRFLITLNWHFTDYLFGKLPDFSHLNLPFSITICTIYFLLLITLTYTNFINKNIKNI